MFKVSVRKSIYCLFLLSIVSIKLAIAQKNVLAFDYGIIYTLPNKKYIQTNEGMRYGYQNPAEAKFSFQFSRKLKHNLFYGIGIGLENFDFGLDNSFNNVSRDSSGNVSQVTGATARSSDLFNRIYKLNATLGYEMQLSKRSSIIANIQPSIFYYFHNKNGNDTALLNGHIWQSQGAAHFSFVVLTESVVQHPGWHFTLMGNLAYRYKLGKKQQWGINGAVGYQQGFGHFIKFRQRLFNLNRPGDYTIVEHRLNGRSMQFTLGLSYHFGRDKN